MMVTGVARYAYALLHLFSLIIVIDFTNHMNESNITKSRINWISCYYVIVLMRYQPHIVEFFFPSTSNLCIDVC